jgi:hypothetical protein
MFASMNETFVRTKMAGLECSQFGESIGEMTGGEHVCFPASLTEVEGQHGGLSCHLFALLDRRLQCQLASEANRLKYGEAISRVMLFGL